MKREPNTSRLKSHDASLVMKVTCSFIARKIRHRERYNVNDRSATAVIILPDLGAEQDILVRSVDSLEPEHMPFLLGVYVKPTEQMIRDDLDAFYA